MKALHKYWLVVSLLLVTAGCATSGGENSPVGKTLYTQVNMYSLKGEVVTWVNYHVDTLIPTSRAPDARSRFTDVDVLDHQVEQDPGEIRS